MSFLAPLYLLLAGAAAVPLLIHLMRRRTGARVEFPAARYLARAEREHSRTLRLRNLLLMLLRVLIVLLVALAAARPVIRFIGGGHAPTALAIVVDNSLSTGVVLNGRPLLDSLKGLARSALDKSASGDRLWLVTADARLRGGNPAVLRQELDRVHALGGAGDLRLAVVRAAGAARGAGLDAQQVAILTDGQRTTWDSTYDVGAVDAVMWAASGTPPLNRSVASVRPQPQRWTPRGELVARAVSPDSATYMINLDGRSLARGTAAPGEEITVRAAPPERGWVAGSVELEPDELPADDARPFAVWIGSAPGVSVSPGAGPFVASAVDVLRGSERVATGSDIGISAADELTTLPALIVAPSDPVRMGAANRALERAGVPWRFGSARHGQGVARGNTVDGATVSLRYELIPQGAAPTDTLATVGTAPWIVAGNGYVLVGSPLVPDATALPVRASFVPWLAEVLTERLVGEPGQVITASPGARLAVPGWADALETPQGARTPLMETLQVPPDAGTYFLLRAGRRVGALVVAPEPQESVLDRTPAAEIAKRFHAADVQVANTPAEWRESVFGAASRRSLLQPLLFAALALLAVEAVLVRASARRVA